MKWTKEEIELGVSLLNSGKTFIDLATVLNKTQISVTKKFNRLGYKSGYNNSNGCAEYSTIYETYDWDKIQKKHNEGYSYRELIKKCELTPQAINWAKDNGQLKFRTLKDGVRLARKKGLGINSKKTGLDRYRQLCEFKFNLKDHPNKFDFTLIKEHGWYKAKNRGDNPDGISRDHMYSINDGFKNNVDPYYLSHPANCRLIKQKDNSKKRDKSCITLKELITRVSEW